CRSTLRTILESKMVRTADPTKQGRESEDPENHFPTRFNCRFAASTTFSVENPKSLSRSLSGAEAPNDRIPMLSPSRPTYFAQPNTDASSTETRAVTFGG